MVNTATAPDPGAVKPGWTTTEFYQTLLVNVIAAIVAIVTLFKTNFNLNGVQAAVPAVALAAATVSQAFYTLSRAKVKAAAQDASARVKSAQAPPPSTDTPRRCWAWSAGTRPGSSARSTSTAARGPTWRSSGTISRSLSAEKPRDVSR